MTPQMSPVRRVSLATAKAWLDGLALADGEDLAAVDIGLCGRVLARDVISPTVLPPRDTVIVDGFAVRAEGIIGASDYNPIRLSLGTGGQADVDQAMAVVSGDAVPDGFDTVLPIDCVEWGEGSIEVAEAVPRGNGIVRTGQTVASGSQILAADTCIGPADVMLLAEAGCARVALRRRPIVALLSFGAKVGLDASSATLGQLVGRDGASLLATGGDSTPLASRLRACADADLILLVGRSGWGDDDLAETLIRQAGGSLEHHGLALRPCNSVGFGQIGGVPLLLLPGDPLSAWVAYEILVARLLRRWGGMSSAIAYGSERRILSRKIVSPVGIADWVPLLYEADGRVAPLPIPKASPVVVLGRADAFALMTAESEGAAPGDSVTIHPLRS